ncbi:hypothetical protein BAUCODRAFT_24945 [Baudoinia panamericana UAMH 10762]|uniref:Uncharacterized protein n=1 Tax=Baudoinia panamericana (strain UAMH 10762) TaxID=717646 RepID=M2LNP8_BAUPA|nr:uncharacterized protein BAUCODRAFT_24945 [Baudoinia panamericana UAMH 10762]EMC95977.1 hypothetical protein BAUCODRAFT_24945 [Baudoinia panamericana UAMH 10762]
MRRTNVACPMNAPVRNWMLRLCQTLVFADEDGRLVRQHPGCTLTVRCGKPRPRPPVARVSIATSPSINIADVDCTVYALSASCVYSLAYLRVGVMGNTSSQLADTTQTEAAAQLQPQGSESVDSAGSPDGSEVRFSLLAVLLRSDTAQIIVPRPWSKAASPKKRKRTTYDHNDVGKEQMGLHSSKKARGRPRDPSLLKPGSPNKPVSQTANGDVDEVVSSPEVQAESTRTQRGARSAQISDMTVVENGTGEVRSSLHGGTQTDVDNVTAPGSMPSNHMAPTSFKKHARKHHASPRDAQTATFSLPQERGRGSRRPRSFAQADRAVIDVPATQKTNAQAPARRKRLKATPSSGAYAQADHREAGPLITAVHEQPQQVFTERKPKQSRSSLEASGHPTTTTPKTNKDSTKQVNDHTDGPTRHVLPTIPVAGRLPREGSSIVQDATTSHDATARSTDIPTPPVSSQQRQRPVSQRSTGSVPKLGADIATSNVFTTVRSDANSGPPMRGAKVESRPAWAEHLIVTRGINIGRSQPVAKPEPLLNGPKSGMFTDAEKAIADDLVDHYAQTTGYGPYELCIFLGHWPNSELQDFKPEILKALPNRKNAAIRKFCARRYFPRKEGPWTESEDERLEKAHIEYGDKWEELAEVIDDRTAQQCRDRWRNHVQYEGYMETGAWSREEEAKLIRAVHECMDMVREEKVRAGEQRMKPEDVEKLVSWDAVSNKMKASRGRKRCSEKWQALKRRHGGMIPAVPAEATVVPVDVEQAASASAFDDKTKAQRLVAKKFEKFQTGDIYDALVEVMWAITDHTKTFSEDSTLWSAIAVRNKGSRFEGALRRRAYYYALEQYGQKPAVKAATTVAAKAREMVLRFQRFAAKNGTTVDDFERGYMPEKAPRRPKRKVLSAETVEESSESEAEPAKPSTASKKRKAVSHTQERKVLSAVRVENSSEDEAALAKPSAASTKRKAISRSEEDGVVIQSNGAQDVQSRSSTQAQRKKRATPAKKDKHSSKDSAALHHEAEVAAMPQQVPEGDPPRYAAHDDADHQPRMVNIYQNLGRSEFIQRCRDAGGRQHQQHARTQRQRL